MGSPNLLDVSVDDDTEKACIALWNSDGTNLPTLFKVPPIAGRLKQNLPKSTGVTASALPRPYAQVDCVKGKEPINYTGGARSDFRKLTITIYGERADVVKALGFALFIFNKNTVLQYPSTNPQTKLPRFVRFWPFEPGGKIEQDKDTVAGLDQWKGIIEGEVWSVRVDNATTVPTPLPATM